MQMELMCVLHDFIKVRHTRQINIFSMMTSQQRVLSIKLPPKEINQCANKHETQTEQNITKDIQLAQILKFVVTCTYSIFQR